MRQLVFDGAPSANLYGVNIIGHWGVGFNMFLDKDTCNVRFIEADSMFSHITLKELEVRLKLFSYRR